MVSQNPKQQSVLFINRVYPPARGASGRVLRDLARYFADNGWDVSVLTTGTDAVQEMDGKVKVIRVKSVLKSKTAWGYMRAWIALFMRAMKMPAPGLVVTLTDPPMTIMTGRIFSKFKKCRHIHWCHDLYPDLLPLVGLDLPAPVMQVLKKHTRKAMKKCDKVISIGRCMAKQLTHTGVEPARVAVIPNWPDYEILDPSKAGSDYKPFQLKNPDKVRPADQQVRDDNPKFRVLYAGNLGRMHPVQSLLDAALFMQEMPEMEFCFIGDGPSYTRLAQERSKRGIENIRLLPYQPAEKLRYVMESGDIHVVTLRDDAAGLLVPCKFYAALAVGRPVIFIGPEDCEITRVIRDFKAGVVVPPRDTAKLVEAITQYRMDSDTWFLHQTGAIEAGKAFTPDHSMEEWIKRAEDALVEPLI